MATGSLIHDRATLGRCDTMREELITATRPTGQNYYRANPIGNELGTEPAPRASASVRLANLASRSRSGCQNVTRSATDNVIMIERREAICS